MSGKEQARIEADKHIIGSAELWAKNRDKVIRQIINLMRLWEITPQELERQI